jgi:hypothetical protein
MFAVHGHSSMSTGERIPTRPKHDSGKHSRPENLKTTVECVFSIVAPQLQIDGMTYHETRSKLESTVVKNNLRIKDIIDWS